jgi:hypothetical protein
VASEVVYCPSPTADWPGPHQTDRAICIFQRRPGCPTCEKRSFRLRFQRRQTLQVVACPQWDLESDMNHLDPVAYVPISREVCLSRRPTAFCNRCPNSQPKELPRTENRWLETERRLRALGVLK